MAIWEDFEIQCTDYLNQRFGAYARFHSTLMQSTLRLNVDNLFYYQT